MSNEARNALFMAGIDESEGGLYEGWNELLSNVTVANRTVFYDSNIAFTDGTISCSASTNNQAKTVPNLYETLNGLNHRINEIHEYISDGISCDLNLSEEAFNTLNKQTMSTADAYTFVSRQYSDTIIAPGNGVFSIDDYEDRAMSTGVFNDASSTLTLDAKNIRFKVDKQIYSLHDIFDMIKELDARTYALKTSITTRTLNDTDFTSDRFSLSANIINEQQ